MIDTVIFDLDGTLLNTLGDLHSCFNYSLKSIGYKERSLNEVREFVGNGITKAFEQALGDNCKDVEKAVKIFKDYYINHMYELTAPYDGILEMLKELKQKNYAVGVVSNKYDKAVKELCKKYFGEYISVAIGESETVKRKPSSDGVLQAIKELNSNINNVIYVGDSEVDIETAKNTNVPCISVLWGFKDRKFLEQNGAKLFAKTPKDIIGILLTQ